MAPPEHTFPVGELEKRVHTHTVNLKEKNRKLGKDFDLKNCQLYELVQYSCTPPFQQKENMRRSGGAASQMECFPFVRLFRRCGEGDKMFHVETTAWEGQHAWPRQITLEEQSTQDPQSNTFANYAGFTWSKR